MWPSGALASLVGHYEIMDACGLGTGREELGRGAGRCGLAPWCARPMLTGTGHLVHAAGTPADLARRAASAATGKDPTRAGDAAVCFGPRTVGTDTAPSLRWLVSRSLNHAEIGTRSTGIYTNKPYALGSNQRESPRRDRNNAITWRAPALKTSPPGTA